MPLSDAAQGPPNVWVVLCTSPPTPQQPVPPGAVPACMPMSPHNAYGPQPAPQPSYFPYLGGELQQSMCGPASLMPPGTPLTFAASPSMYNATAGSSPFAEGRPGLGSMGYGQPSTPRLVQPSASPHQPAADLTERPMRPPPPAELAWLLSQLPPASPLACAGMQPLGGMCPLWQQAASLVQGLPASQAQPLLQPVERLPPPPPLPDACWSPALQDCQAVQQQAAAAATAQWVACLSCPGDWMARSQSSCCCHSWMTICSTCWTSVD